MINLLLSERIGLSHLKEALVHPLKKLLVDSIILDNFIYYLTSPFWEVIEKVVCITTSEDIE